MEPKLRVLMIACLVLSGSLFFLPVSEEAEAQGATDYLAYWSFDEGSGSTAADASANGYDGTVNGASWTTGLLGGALDFDGSNDYVSVLNHSSLHNLNSLTFEAWIYPRANSHWHVISKGTGSKRLYSEAYLSTLDLTGRVRYAPVHAYAASVDNTVDLDTWQHVVMTWSISDDIVRIYHNGAEVSYSSLSSGTGTIEDDSTHQYVIGARSDLSSGCFFDGIIDEVYLWDRVMPLSEISDRYEALTFPGPPQNLTATSGDGQVTLNWDAPAFQGSSAITFYRIYRGTISGSTSFIYEVGNVFTYTDPGLTNGVTYYYDLTAVNSEGEGEPSTEVSATPGTPVTVPGIPQSLVATPGNSQVQLDWAAPSSNGGSTITNYKIYRGTSAGGAIYLTEIGNYLTYTDTSLTNGQTYFYQVSAVNSMGEGSRSAEASATPMAVPSAPSNLQATAGNGYVLLTWSAPSDDGGSPVTSYVVYRGTSGGAETLLTTLGNVLAYNDTGVTNEQTYHYRVSAVNSEGEGAQSAARTATPTAISTGDGLDLNSLLLPLLLLLLIIIIIVVIFLATRRRKRDEDATPPTPAPAVPPPPAQAPVVTINPGRNHLFLTDDVGGTYKAFKSLVDAGTPGLCITNRFPDNVRSDHGLAGTRIIWLSETGKGDDIFKPQRMDFELTRSLNQFMKENPEPVILIDCLDYLMLNNGFENVSAFLKRITDSASMQRATLVVVARPEALPPDKLSYLKGQFDRVV